MSVIDAIIQVTDPTTTLFVFGLFVYVRWRFDQAERDVKEIRTRVRRLESNHMTINDD